MQGGGAGSLTPPGGHGSAEGQAEGCGSRHGGQAGSCDICSAFSHSAWHIGRFEAAHTDVAHVRGVTHGHEYLDLFVNNNKI